MSMAEKHRKLLEAKSQANQTRPPARAPIMVLAAAEEPEPGPGSMVPAESESVLPDPRRKAAMPMPNPKPGRKPKRRPAEKVGAALDQILKGLEARGVSRRTPRLSIPYSLRLDSELSNLLRSGGGSAASLALEALRTTPWDNLNAIAGAASLVAERRRRPSRGGLGQSGTITVNLDGPTSQTLEVLAKRAQLSCAAVLEGCALIWAARQGLLQPEALD